MSISTDSEETKRTASVIVAGGLDPSGGAGLAADILAVHAAGVIALPIATALTVQDSRTVYTSYPVDELIVREQLAAVWDDFKPKYLKMGMVGSAAIARTVADFIDSHGIRLILDPVMASTNGRPLLDDQTKEAVALVLVPKAFLITPNAMEVESLTGLRLTDEDSIREAGKKLAEMGSQNTLIKGGHIVGERGNFCVDYLYNEGEFKSLRAVRICRGEIRGTGCHLASAIAGFLAKGFELPKAVEEAKRYVTDMIKIAGQGGRGAGQAY